MADGVGNDDGVIGDPVPLLDDFDDVLQYLNDLPGDDDDPVDPTTPTAAAAVEVLPQYNADVHPAPPSGGHDVPDDGVDLYQDWPAAMLADSNHFNISVDGAAPVASVAPPVYDGAPSTSAAAARRAPAGVLDCRGCQVLRQTIHSNGFESTKLCIHGDAGVFYHATFEVYRVNSNGIHAATLTHQSYVDFRSRDYEWVKRYLTDYALRRAAGNFALVHDSLAAFHDVLCTTMNPIIPTASVLHATVDVHERRPAPMTATTNDGGGGGQLVVSTAAASAAAAVQPATSPADTHPSSGTTVEVQPVVRSALALQRERTARLQLDDIRPYFHLPMVEAGKRLGICATVLKGVCRRVGIQRWPHRKVKQIDKEITRLMRSGDGAWAREGIEKLNARRRRIFEGLG